MKDTSDFRQATREALTRSKTMTTGNHWWLFCRQLGFICWTLLCALTLVIGNLAMMPYRQAAETTIYCDLPGGAVSQMDSKPIIYKE